MVRLWFHGGGVRCWYGMQHVRTHWPHLTQHLPSERLVLSQPVQNRERGLSTCTSKPHTTLLPVAVETLGPIGEEGRAFLKELGRRIAATCFEPLSYQYLLQRVAVAIQWGNAAAVLGTI